MQILNNINIIGHTIDIIVCSLDILGFPMFKGNDVKHTLETKEVGVKKYVVDSYAQNKGIVSRKFTQLSEVQEKTAKSYLNEITKKYPSVSKISNGPFNPNALKGGDLKVS
ncbi:hypothetical protein ACT7CZ_02525 [Bacillus cereus]